MDEEEYFRQIERSIYTEDLVLFEQLLNESIFSSLDFTNQECASKKEVENASVCGESVPWTLLPPAEKGGWPILHHLVKEQWHDGLELYANLARRISEKIPDSANTSPDCDSLKKKMMNVESTDRVISTNLVGFSSDLYFIGGQTALFVAETIVDESQRRAMIHWLKQHGVREKNYSDNQDVRDWNGQTAHQAAAAEKNQKSYRLNGDLVKQRCLSKKSKIYLSQLQDASRRFDSRMNKNMLTHKFNVVKVMDPFFLDESVSPITPDIVEELVRDFPCKREDFKTSTSEELRQQQNSISENVHHSQGVLAQIDFSKDDRLVRFFDSLSDAADELDSDVSPHNLSTTEKRKLFDSSQNVVSQIDEAPREACSVNSDQGEGSTNKGNLSGVRDSAKSYPIDQDSHDSVSTIAHITLNLLDLISDSGPTPSSNGIIERSQPSSTFEKLFLSHHKARMRIASTGLRPHYDDSKFTLSIQLSDMRQYQTTHGGGELVLPELGCMVKPRKYTGVFFSRNMKHLVRNFNDSTESKKNLVIWWH